jgi:hypothetical protein
VKGHRELFFGGDGIIDFNSETFCAQVDHFACKLIKIDLPEMNNAGHWNSGGFSSILPFRVHFSRSIKGSKVLKAGPTVTYPFNIPQRLPAHHARSHLQDTAISLTVEQEKSLFLRDNPATSLH